MFTTFLIGTLIAVTAFMVGLLFRHDPEGSRDARIPYAGLTVLALALGLAVWGLAILG